MKTSNSFQRTAWGVAAAGLIATAGVTTAAAPASAAVSSSFQTAEVSAFDKTYLETAMHGMYFETQFGQLARDKASNEKVRAYGEEFLHDHAAFRVDLEKLAGDMGVTLPTELHPQGKALIASIAAKSGKDFDKAWAEGNAVGHQGAVMGAKIASTKAQDPRVRALAKSQLKVLEHHYASALGLARELGTNNPKLINAGEGPVEPTNRLPLFGALALLVVGVSVASRSAMALRRSS